MLLLQLVCDLLELGFLVMIIVRCIAYRRCRCCSGTVHAPKLFYHY